MTEESPKASSRTYRKCLGCETYNRFVFYTPDTVYCDECGQVVGETDPSVEFDLVALSGDRIVNSETGNEIATVEWDSDRTEVHHAE